MPLQVMAMAVADDGTGTSHPNAIFVPLDTIMVFKTQTGSVGWECWHDGPTLLNHLATGADGPISQCGIRQQLGNKEYALVSALMQAAGSFEANITQALIYSAQIILDVDTGQKDALGNPIMVSRFANGKPVMIG